MKIGLTGSIACGKTTVSSYLRSLGFFTADADRISHDLTAAGGAALPLILREFGSSVFRDGQLDRRALAAVVFADPAARARLNAILHPMIMKQMQEELETHGASGKTVFADIPLLYECGMEKDFDEVWVVSLPAETQLQRLMERDCMSREDALVRIASQMPVEEKEKLADRVIRTDGTIEETQRKVQHLIDSLHLAGGEK